MLAMMLQKSIEFRLDVQRAPYNYASSVSATILVPYTMRASKSSPFQPEP